MKVDLTKKVAIVTGGSEGIGKGIALEVAASGAVTYLTARSLEDSLQRLGLDLRILALTLLRVFRDASAH